MTSQQQLVCDSSTLANFKQWAQAISTFFSTAGWVQTSDTGQVNWSSIASVPGSGAYVYEVWKPGDALTPYFVKVEYGNVSGTNCPGIRISLGQTTNGAGTMTGNFFGPIPTVTLSYTPPSTTTQYECDFSGDAGRMCVMMWRNGINNCQQFFAIERSLNASGVYTGTYATLYAVGNCNGTNSFQQTLLFGVGPAPAINHATSGSGWCIRLASPPGGSGAFNGAIPMDLCAPVIGYVDYPGTVAGGGMYPDFAEGVTFTTSVYGATRTYMVGKNYPFSQFGLINNSTSNALLMRYD